MYDRLDGHPLAQKRSPATRPLWGDEALAEQGGFALALMLGALSNEAACEQGLERAAGCLDWARLGRYLQGFGGGSESAGILGSVLMGERVAPKPESCRTPHQVLWESPCDHSDIGAVAGSGSWVWLDGLRSQVATDPVS